MERGRCDLAKCYVLPWTVTRTPWPSLRPSERTTSIGTSSPGDCIEPWTFPVNCVPRMLARSVSPGRKPSSSTTVSSMGTLPYAVFPCMESDRVARNVRAKLPPLVLVDVGLECTDVGKIPVALVVVQAVPHDEGRRDREPVVADVERDLLNLGLSHQGADLEAPRLAALQVLEQVGERQTRVDDVFDDEDVPVVQVEVEVLQDPHDAARAGGRPVARDSHEVELRGDADCARDVGHHHEDRKSTRLNSSHVSISYAVFCLKKKK